MNIALINKQTSVCENIAVFVSLEIAEEMFGKTHILAEVQSGYGIGDTYKDEEWSKKDPIPVVTEPTTEEYLLDFEYRISMMELGGNA